MHLWLSKEEVRELTGKVQKQAQKRQLTALGYHWNEHTDGSFVVPTAQFMTPQANAPTAEIYKLDFSGLGNGAEAA